MDKYITSFTFLLFSLFANTIIAQCSMVELPLEQKIEKSSDIIEGRVVSKKSFWNEKHNFIYTSNKIEIFKIFKGALKSSLIEIITEGGIIGNQHHGAAPNLSLEIGELGIFMCIPSLIQDLSKSTEKVTTYKCYGGPQGFFKYDQQSNSATAPFIVYKDIQSDLYVSIVAITGSDFQELSPIPFNSNAQIIQSLAKAGGSINSFSPTTISGGTFSILTINGVGFGATQSTSTVNFRNADNGGTGYMSPLAIQYISWSDTKIEVEVPSDAGTGTIQVVVAGFPITSSSELTIKFNELNTSGDTAYQTTLADINDAGGITWRLNTEFKNNTPANNAFRRAVQTWNTGTKINWDIGATTNLDVIAYDSISVVRFDNGNELPDGTLARCHYYWGGCGVNVADVWAVYELDMVVDESTLWEYGPSEALVLLYDFETVMLHELGHGHQLGHVIESTDVMHYSVTSATSKRTLNANNLEGGNEVMSRSVIGNSCGLDPMVPKTLFVLDVENEVMLSEQVIVYPNPGSGIINMNFVNGINNYEQIILLNSYGQELELQSSAIGSDRLELDFSGFPSGIYCLILDSGTASINKKIMIQ